MTKFKVKEAYTGSFTSHYLHKYFSIDVPAKIFGTAGYNYAALMTALATLDRRKLITNQP